MNTGAHALGAAMLLLLGIAVLRTYDKDMDPEHSKAPINMAEGIVPFLAYVVLAWWLLFR